MEEKRDPKESGMIKTFKRDDGARILHSRERYQYDAWFHLVVGGAVYRFCLSLGGLCISLEKR